MATSLPRSLIRFVVEDQVAQLGQRLQWRQVGNTVAGQVQGGEEAQLAERFEVGNLIARKIERPELVQAPPRR